jgi:hypothetical protein
LCESSHGVPPRAKARGYEWNHPGSGGRPFGFGGEPDGDEAEGVERRATTPVRAKLPSKWAMNADIWSGPDGGEKDGGEGAGDAASWAAGVEVGGEAGVACGRIREFF